jgi:hypothetical protein
MLYVMLSRIVGHISPFAERVSGKAFGKTGERHGRLEKRERHGRLERRVSYWPATCAVQARAFGGAIDGSIFTGISTCIAMCGRIMGFLELLYRQRSVAVSLLVMRLGCKLTSAFLRASTCTGPRTSIFLGQKMLYLSK